MPFSTVSNMRTATYDSRHRLPLAIFYITHPPSTHWSNRTPPSSSVCSLIQQVDTPPPGLTLQNTFCTAGKVRENCATALGNMCLHSDFLLETIKRSRTVDALADVISSDSQLGVRTAAAGALRCMVSRDQYQHHLRKVNVVEALEESLTSAVRNRRPSTAGGGDSHHRLTSALTCLVNVLS